MASIAEVRLAEGEDRVVKVGQGKSSGKTFTVTNKFGNSMRIGFKCVFENGEQVKWARPGGALERELGDQGSDRVSIGISPTEEVKPGKYSVKLLAYSLKDPDVNFSLSDTIDVEVLEKGKTPIWPIVVGIVVVLLLVGGILTWVFYPRDLIVPDVVGVPVDVANERILEAKLTSEILEKITGTKEAGIVLGQFPPPNEKIKKDDIKPVKLEVEAFSIAVPVLKGMTLEQATEKLKLDGLKPGQVVEKKTGASGGTIVGSEPNAGERVAPEAQITLWIETRDVQVPNVAGQKLADGTQAMEALGLRVNVEMTHVAGTEPLRILSTRPPASSSVRQGQVVTLVVEKQMVRVPNTVGKNIKEATEILKRANLRVGSIQYRVELFKPAGAVYAQKPATNASVDPHTPVTLYAYKSLLVSDKIVPFTNVQTLNSLQTIRREAPPQQ